MALHWPGRDRCKAEAIELKRAREILKIYGGKTLSAPLAP